MTRKQTDFLFSGDDGACRLLVGWWKGLEDERGARAELRRAGAPSEVVYCAYFHRLLNGLVALEKPFDKAKIAAIAGFAAHVKTNTEFGPTFARQMAAPRSGGSGAKVSGLRFRRLLAVKDKDVEEIYPMMIRVIKILDGEVNLADLAPSVYWWNEKTKMRWASEYYAAAPSET